MSTKQPKKVKRPRKYTVTSHDPHPLWVAFDQYISLFIVPIALFIRAVMFIQSGNAIAVEGLIAGIWIFIAVLTALFLGIFLLLNMYWWKWRLNWWKNLLLSGLIFLLSSFVLALIIRISG